MNIKLTISNLENVSIKLKQYMLLQLEMRPYLPVACGVSKQLKYTQTKKNRPIFMVLYLSIQLRCCSTNKTKMLIKRPTHKNGNYLILSSNLEGLLNLMHTQLFPLSSGS